MKVWEDKRIPDDWNEATIIRIPKKGASNDCNNWRGITLLSIPSEILAKIIMNRLCNVVDSRLSEEQAGFRKGKGCIDQIFALRNIIEQCTEWQRKLYINFVDFEKKKHLIAFIETVFGKSGGITESHKKLSPPYKVFTTTLTAEWVTASTVFLCFPE